MFFKFTASSLGIAALLSLGCDTNPIDGTGGDALPTTQTPVTGQNYSDPGRNPGLSGAAPHPDRPTGTVLDGATGTGTTGTGTTGTGAAGTGSVFETTPGTGTTIFDGDSATGTTGPGTP